MLTKLKPSKLPMTSHSITVMHIALSIKLVVPVIPPLLPTPNLGDIYRADMQQ